MGIENFDYSTSMGADAGFAAAGILLGVVMLVYLLFFGLALAQYIMTSLSLYTIAKRRGISNPWLAWLPYGNNWIIGSIADHYDAQHGIKRKWRVVLLLLPIIAGATVAVLFIVMFFGIISMALQMGDSFGAESVSAILSVILPFYLGLIAVALLEMAASACQMICLFKIFESTVPEKALTYFLVSLLVPLGQPICLMKARKCGYEVAPPTPQWTPVPPPAQPVPTAEPVVPAVAAPTEEPASPADPAEPSDPQ